MQILPKRLSHCVLGKESFIEGMEYVSLLDDLNNRYDYCLNCWEKSSSLEQPAFEPQLDDFFAEKARVLAEMRLLKRSSKNKCLCHGHYWKGKIPVKKNKSFPPDEKAMHLFRNSTDQKKRFILAIYLHGQKQLHKITKTLYELPETGELFDVELVVMSPEETECVAKEIHRLLREL